MGVIVSLLSGPIRAQITNIKALLKIKEYQSSLLVLFLHSEVFSFFQCFSLFSETTNTSKKYTKYTFLYEQSTQEKQ